MRRTRPLQTATNHYCLCTRHLKPRTARDFARTERLIRRTDGFKPCTANLKVRTDDLQAFTDNLKRCQVNLFGARNKIFRLHVALRLAVVDLRHENDRQPDGKWNEKLNPQGWP
jgi:hypothetical protein